MFLVLEIINPMYLLVACCCFMIVVGCACYGCYDIVSEKSLDAVAAGGVVACDMSDCEIPEIHEQHLEDKADGFWGKKAWGTDSDTCPGGIFDLPIESTSIPDDYGGGGYGGSSGGTGGQNHQTIDMDFTPGIDGGGGEGIEGPLKGANDTTEITIDMTNAVNADEEKDANAVVEIVENPPMEDADGTETKPPVIEDNDDTSDATKKDLEKVSESKEESSSEAPPTEAAAATPAVNNVENIETVDTVSNDTVNKEVTDDKGAEVSPKVEEEEKVSSAQDNPDKDESVESKED